MKDQTKKVILTSEIRKAFKEILLEELNELPKHLKTLEPKERVELFCKLIPFIMPKVNKVHYTEGEPFNREW